MTLKNAATKNGIPDKIYGGDSEELDKLHKQKDFSKVEMVHNSKRYKNLVFKYGRVLVDITPEN